MGRRNTSGHWLIDSALLSLQVDCLGLWLAVELEPWMAPEPAPGRRMVPLVPALVMLGLMAGAHGDSKSDSSSSSSTSRCSRLESDMPSSRSLEWNTGLGPRKKKQSDQLDNPLVLLS